MMKRMITALLVLCCSSVYTIQVCPSGPVWNRRAADMCSSQYHCLLDVNTKNKSVGFFVEKCLSPKRYKGKRYIFSGNLNALDCDQNRFSPQHTWSNDTRDSECSLHKSQCIEEGHVIVDNGTSEKDRTCRCNYKEGYTYVKRPDNPCRCFPKIEDCSCYIHKCSNPENVLTPDYECEKRDVLKFFSCDVIAAQKSHKSVTEIKLDDKIQRTNGNLGVHRFDRVPVVYIIILISTALFFAGIVIVGVWWNNKVGRNVVKIGKQLMSSNTPDRSMHIVLPDKIYRGERIILDIVISNPIGIQNVVWYRKNNDREYKKIQTSYCAKYAGSTIASPSLIINNVNVSDSGVFRCQIAYNDGTSLTCEQVIKIPEEIFIQEMNVVSFFQPTEELNKIEDLIDNSNEKLLILEGLHGSGKTQTVHKFCTAVKDKYSIIAKIKPSETLSFKDALVDFANDMHYRISYEKAVNFKVVVDNIKDCLNQADRYQFPYLIFLDNIDKETLLNYDEIKHFVSTLAEVPNLSIILATTDPLITEHFGKNHYRLVKFNGMSIQEYHQIWLDLDVKKEDIDRLSEKTGKLPLAVISAIQSMLIFKWTIDQLITEFSFKNFPDISSTCRKLNYDTFAIGSQMTILSNIKKTFSDNEWNVIQLIPYLSYNALSSTVLEACYFHMTRYRTDRRGNIHTVLKALRDIPLCQVKYVKPVQFETTSSDKSSKMCGHTIFSFHKVTIDALQLLLKSDSSDNCENLVRFLLKLFCFEIDLDVATDVTVERNFRFVDHAIKLLKMEPSRHKKENVNFKSFMLETGHQLTVEDKLYISYLHCAIGSTFLLDRTIVEKAHQHLMKAREMFVNIVERKSDVKKDNCIYLQDLDNVPAVEEIDKINTRNFMEQIAGTKASESFVKSFILGKHRSFSDIDVFKNEISEELKVLEFHYLQEEDYNILVDKKLALPWTKLTELFHSELLLRILHNNGIALYDLKYVIKSDEESKENKMMWKTCRREFETATVLNKTIEDKFSEHSQLFVCIRNKRHGRMISNNEPVTTEDLHEEIKYYESMIKKDTSIIYDFGIVKFTDKSNFRHKSLCRRNLLYHLVKGYKVEQNKEIRQKQLEKCATVLEELLNDINQMELNNLGYSWLMLPLLYIECGNCLMLYEDASNLERALKCFNNALSSEERRGALRTRFTFESYLGQIQCLHELSRMSEAYSVINKAIHILTGQNREEMLKMFQSLKLQVKFNVRI